MAVVRKANKVGIAPASLSRAEAIALITRSGLLAPPVNVLALAEYLGLEVKEEAMDDGMSGFLEFRSGRWVAGLNSYHHPNRKRFTLAHEIAHFLLHRNEKSRFDDEVFTRRLGTRDRMELEADAFAAELLMPEIPFRQKVNEGLKNVSELAAAFGVSNHALRYRAETLGYRIT